MDNVPEWVSLIIIVPKLTTKWIVQLKPTDQPKSSIERKEGQSMTALSTGAAIQEWSNIEGVGSTAKLTG